MVVLAQDFVVEGQVELVADAEAVRAVRAAETLEVVDVALGAHHHLERRNVLAARRAKARRAEQPVSKRRSTIGHESTIPI